MNDVFDPATEQFGFAVVRFVSADPKFDPFGPKVSGFASHVAVSHAILILDWKIMIDMDSASPAIAGIGQKTARDASSVAFTPSAGFFKRDFAEHPTAYVGANRWQAYPRRRRAYRRSDHPLATGDGHA
ncbi:hypothetical protein C475_15188 [Halosimplex carlsbadense 2-9-1]|uniref:Uncharacterized protein n=1 Tax=Halosimplex carlsbadense 2-9-1 TaxID=797114 RepID=M0CMK8_9EURY|nr:hypothetical protein [Halosimplex carlsbadense]ELZ23627.1 hypothetical protein C475_15188 [Halosimplex carlsbadense 2-9-1]